MFEIIPYILFLAVIGTAIAERINVPYPLVLVIAGLITGFTPGMPTWQPHSHIVLPLFLPPILFAAARLISWQEIRENLAEIFSLSIGLVIFSSIAIGFILHWIVPGMSFSAALVLGAIISPTDCIAATSILNKMNVRQRLVRTLEIESLFNDATSILLYSMAVLLVYMGSVRVSASFLHIFYVSIGGIGVGLALAFITGYIIKKLLASSENELPIIMSLILAYVAYLFAERLGVSGVLAVVTAGLFHRRTERHILARTRLTEKSAWDTYIFFLNGLIFIAIGMQLPLYLDKIKYLPITQFILFSIVTISTLTISRFIWVALTAYLIKLTQKIRSSKPRAPTYTWSDITIASWSGMRGMVSLALAVALPLNLTGTIEFPYRSLIIFLSIIAILFSLLAQGLTLPRLIKYLGVTEKEDDLHIEADLIYKKLTQHAIKHLGHIATKENLSQAQAKQLVENYYHNRLLHFKLSDESNKQIIEMNRKAHLFLKKILQYERNVLHDLLERGEITDEVYIRIYHKLDRDEVGFAI
jgi:Na+/H+ antiporter